MSFAWNNGQIKILNFGQDTHNRQDEVCKYIHQEEIQKDQL